MRVEEKSLHNAKESPILSFLHRELTGALELIAKIHNNLGCLAKFLRGTQVLSQELHAIVCSLLQSKTPAAWLAMWSTGPEDCSFFIQSTVAKTRALQVLKLVYCFTISQSPLKHLAITSISYHKLYRCFPSHRQVSFSISIYHLTYLS